MIRRNQLLVHLWICGHNAGTSGSPAAVRGGFATDILIRRLGRKDETNQLELRGTAWRLSPSTVSSREQICWKQIWITRKHTGTSFKQLWHIKLLLHALIMYVCIYIYIERERQISKWKQLSVYYTYVINTCMYILYIYIYINIHTYIHNMYIYIYTYNMAVDLNTFICKMQFFAKKNANLLRAHVFSFAGLWVVYFCAAETRSNSNCMQTATVWVIWEAAKCRCKAMLG